MKKKKENNISLKKVINEINKKYGEIILKYAKDEPPKNRIGFGIKEIDELTGGSICGNWIILYGAESVGKSTLALMQIATAQKENKTCVYVDLEHGFDAKRAEQFGVDLSKLILLENIKTAEQAMDIMIKLAREKVIDLVIIDSVQAMSPKGEQETKAGKEKSMEEDEMALLARKLSKFFRMSGTPIYKSKTAGILIGQTRVGGLGTFITKEEMTGGRGLKHWSLMTIYMRRGQKADAPREKYIDEHGKKKERILGFDCVLKIEKQKISNCQPEGSEIHIPFYYTEGFRSEVS